MKILCLGHSFIVDMNRKFWSHLAIDQKVHVDLIAPQFWQNSLIGLRNFKKNDSTDKGLKQIYPIHPLLSGKGSFYLLNPFVLFKVLNSQKYDSIILWEETWSLILLELKILILFSTNK